MSVLFFSKVFPAPPSGSLGKIVLGCSGVFLTVTAKEGTRGSESTPYPGRDEASSLCSGIQNSWARVRSAEGQRLF